MKSTSSPAFKTATTSPFSLALNRIVVSAINSHLARPGVGGHAARGFTAGNGGGALVGAGIDAWFV